MPGATTKMALGNNNKNPQRTHRGVVAPGMFKFKRIKFDRVKKILKKITHILGERSFLVSLALIFLALALGAVIFYKYSILAGKREPEVLGERIYFKEEIFQNIMKIWEDRQKKFEDADLKTYPNPFRVGR